MFGRRWDRNLERVGGRCLVNLAGIQFWDNGVRGFNIITDMVDITVCQGTTVSMLRVLFGRNIHFDLLWVRDNINNDTR
jgi:hypothetical protein